LHPPYTAWHLSYVVIGASLAPRVSGLRLAATLVAFFLAVGVAAHALDELNGRPLRTSIPNWVLKAAGVIGLWGAVGLGLAAFALSFGQRVLSTPARALRRKTRSVTGAVTLSDGSQVALDEATLLRPLERALRAFSWGVVALAVGLVSSKLL